MRRRVYPYHTNAVLKVPIPTPCAGCGATFPKRYNWQKFCAPECRGARLTDYDKKVLNDWRNICIRHNLSTRDELGRITGYDGREFRYLKSRLQRWKTKRPEGRFSSQRKNRFLAIVKRVVDDFNAGWYDVVVVKIYYSQFKKAEMKSCELVRRKEPLVSHCPRRRPGCAGGMYPGDCPWRWRECPLA